MTAFLLSVLVAWAIGSALWDHHKAKQRRATIPTPREPRHDQALADVAERGEHL